MQRNRPPVHGGPAAPNPYYTPNPNPNHPPYYPQLIIPNPYIHHPQQLYSTNGFNSRIQLPGAVPNPAVFVYPYAESSNLYNAPLPPQLGLAHAYPQSVASAPSAMEAAPAPAPSALAAAVAAVMAAYRPEFNPAQIRLNPQSNGVTIQPNVAETFVAANPKPTFGVTIQPNVAETFVAANTKPTFSKKIKKVKNSKKAQIQSPPGWCEVCQIDCTSAAVLLYSHRSGKKHKKNLEKLAASRIIPPVSTSESTRENPDKSTATISKNAKRIAAANVDVETKKRKILEGGATAEDVRMCDVCKVVCNSESVFMLHLVGSKHAAMMKKHGSKNTVVSTSKGENGN